MRAITKGTEPASLTAHRQTDHCDYDNYVDKDALRQALVAEQRGLCCYCMGRIRSGPDTMKIEHWRCQSHHPGQQLDYGNLLGACRGGHTQSPDRQHCDTRKGDRDLRWNPANPAHHIETRLRYEADGSIHSDEADFDAQLAEVLNLNLHLLKNNRKGVLDAILAWWTLHARRLPRGQERRRLEQQRDRRIEGAGELEPYCQVAVWWLKQRLDKVRP